MFLGFTDIGSSFSDNAQVLVLFILFFGLMFFIAGLMDLHISNRRGIILSQDKPHSNWVRIGVIVIAILFLFVLGMYLFLSSFHD